MLWAVFLDCSGGVIWEFEYRISEGVLGMDFD